MIKKYGKLIIYVCLCHFFIFNVKWNTNTNVGIRKYCNNFTSTPYVKLFSLKKI